MLLISQIWVNVCCCIFTLQLDVYYERFVFKKYFLSLICAKYNFYYFCFCIIQISGHFDLVFFSLQNVCTSDFQKRMDFNALIG